MNIKRDTFLKSFGEQVKFLRLEKKLSLRQLSLNCDIDHSDINKIEKGQRNIQLSTLFQLAQALKTTPKQLFDFEFDYDYER